MSGVVKYVKNLNLCVPDPIARSDLAMIDDPISMVQECVSTYAVNEKKDGSIEITIDIPKRFANLWICRLSNLRTSMEEIEAMEASDS